MHTHRIHLLRAISGLLPALAVFLSTGLLKATPVAGDSFIIGKSWYTTGDNNLFPQDPTTPGFFQGWLEAFGESASPDVTGSNMVYNGDATLSSGGSLLADSNGRTGRVLSTAYGNADSGTVYISALLQTYAVTDGYRGLELHDGGFDDGANRVLQLVVGEGGIGSSDSNYVTRVFNNGAFAADLGAGDTNVNLFVIKCTFSTTDNADVIEIYRNPEDLSNEGLSTIDATLTGFNFRFDRISIANFSGGELLGADELRVGTAWADVVGPLDSEPDNVPDAWEAANGLTIGVNDGGASVEALYDNDGLINSDEFLNNTDPNDEDSDNDGLEDGPEVNTYGSCPNDPDTDKDGLEDGPETTGNGGAGISNPLLVDTDGDGFADKVEVDANSNPGLGGSTPSTFADTTLIGLDSFDIVDGSIGGVVSGEGFDLDNSSERDSFTGHTATFSDWDGNAIVNGGKLQTQGGSNAFREFNGTSEGNGANSDEREGTFDALGNFGAQRKIYFRVELTRQCDVTYSGVSLFNADGTEELFFGVLANTLEFGIEELNESNLNTNLSNPVDLQTYTIVGKVDLDTLTASLWVDPFFGLGELPPDVTLSLGGSNFVNEAFLTRLRIESGGGDVTEWDDLVVGTTWDALTTAPTASGGDPDLRDTFEATWGVSDDTANSDGDTLTDGQEQAANTNPTETDTDGDTISDNEEIVAGVDGVITNPRLADTDGDGVNDDVELSGAANQFDGMPTDPLDCDSDDDGEDDGLEIFNVSDPNDENSDSTTVTDIVVNGRRDPLYGGAITVQTVNTEFGDNLSEWNAAYGRVEDGKLYLMFTGNLQDNFNKLELFIDSSDTATTEVYAGIGSNPDGVNAMSGMTFDSGFTPDYHLVLRRGSADSVNRFDLDFIDLAAGTSSFYGDLGSGVNNGFFAQTGTGANATPIKVSYDDSNTGGVVGGTGAADFGAASAAATGLEICIDLCDLGEPDDENIRIMLLQNNESHSFLSNQSLAGMPAGTGNLGDPTTTDFSGITGDQFFSINVPAGAANCAVVDPVALSIQVTGGNAVLTWLPASTAVDLYKSDNLAGGFDPSPISTNDTDGTHTDTGLFGERYYQAVPTGSPAP